jgi:selenocysteine lyase/cysteine desulfurase
MAAAEKIYECRGELADFFGAKSPEEVIFTQNATMAINLVIKGFLRQGDHVLISDMEHNAVYRPIQKLSQMGLITYDCFATAPQQGGLSPAALCAEIEGLIKPNTRMVICAHASNICSAVLPIASIGALCRKRGILFAVDAAQSAGHIPIDVESMQIDALCFPGHKGLLGPQGTGLLLCAGMPKPLLFGGTGSMSLEQQMPDFLPDRLEAGTLNVPGIAGLRAGMEFVGRLGVERISVQEQRLVAQCIGGLKKLGFQVFDGPNQAGVESFVPGMDCQTAADRLARQGVAVRAGLHCSPLAHHSAGTLETGTVRVSIGYDTKAQHISYFLQKARFLQ